MPSRSLQRIIEVGIVLLVLSGLVAGWFFFYKAARQDIAPKNVLAPIEIQGKATIPYFLLAFDRSKSMIETDPENFQKESLKQVVRLIFWNGQQLFKTTGFFPKVCLVSFSGAPEPLSKKEDWISLESEKDVTLLDKQIDMVLDNRDGNFTDINSVVEYVTEIRSKVPVTLGQGNHERPVTLVAILFSDGIIEPNYLNRINHRTQESWQLFVETTAQLAERHMGNGKGETLRQSIAAQRWVDPTVWARQFGKATLSGYYAMNQRYDKEGTSVEYVFAKDEVQKQLKNKMAGFSTPPFRFNVVA